MKEVRYDVKGLRACSRQTLKTFNSPENKNNVSGRRYSNADP